MSIQSPRSSIPQAASRLRLLVTGLPPSTSTLDIYVNFCHYGSVVRIYLFETREGLNSTRAEVDFQPAPTDLFWRQPIIFKAKLGKPVQVRCQLSNSQPRNYSKESPVRKGVHYDERTELLGTCLGFGVLSDPLTMMLMGRAGSIEHKPKLTLNLQRKEIEVQFPWQQSSQRRSASRTFRFIIALDEEFKIWQLPDNSFVFHLTRPPWYSKQLAEAIANTHSPDARIWSIEDTWARQTDLVTYTTNIPEINRSPVALSKPMNDINIFRWTTFRFDPVHDASNIHTAHKFVSALKDWNVKVLDGVSFKTVDAIQDLDQAVWKLINSTHVDQESSTNTVSAKTLLPFSVRYQLEVCLSNGWLSEYSITTEFLQQLADLPEAKALQALVYVALDQRRLFDPHVIFKDIHYSKPVRAKRLPDNCIEIRSAIVTATGVIFQTPAVEITNRIIRNHKSYAHRFLRVRFEDDQYRGQTRLYPTTNNKMIMIFTRVKRALTNGIKLGNIVYDFLAWGNSQLREHGAYFFAAGDGLTAESIRAEMGNFEETVVAKKAARMGQCFSTTRPVHLQLKIVNAPDAIPDIVRNGYTFTDGVGKISPDAAALVASQLQIKGPTPCLFQFRLGGCKGVLAVSKDVPGVDVRIRKSQLKFNSLANELEINRYAQFWQPFLNRQIIICLSSLGVPTEVFIRKQDETIAALNKAMHDDGIAVNTLRSHVDPNMMTLSLSHLVEAGFRTSQEPFVVSFLELWRAWSLKYLKEKAKIPVEHGAFLLGCVDETATLQGHTSASHSGDSSMIMADPSLLEKLPEIFVQFTDHKTGQRKIVEGICILARNPSLHRGDIRVVKARNVPALHHMCDVVVMPQLGDRDLPSMCSGGDLDGDDYIVIWDQDLIPRFWNAEPFHYDPPLPKTAAGEIKTSDLIEFFHDYMQNDALGKIAHAHLAAADYLDNGLESNICLDLVQLHSMAVDYPKTGVPAKMERRLERTQKPHFMEQKFGKFYHSNKVLGQLYDKINKFYEKTQKDTFVKHDLEFDPRILNACAPDAALVSKVEAVKRDYDVSLRRILTQHSIRTEFELWSTFVLDHSKKSRDYKFHEEVGDLSKVLKEEYYEALCEIADGRDFDHLAPVAVAAYRLTRDQLELAKAQAQAPQEDEPEVEMPLITFPWVLQDTMIKIATQTSTGPGSMNNDTVSEPIHDAKSMLKDGAIEPEDGMYDIAQFNLTRDKLSPYLADPLANGIVDQAAGRHTAEVAHMSDPEVAISTPEQDLRPESQSEDAPVLRPREGDQDLTLDVDNAVSTIGALDDSTAIETVPAEPQNQLASLPELKPSSNSSLSESDSARGYKEQRTARDERPTVEFDPAAQMHHIKVPTSPRHQYQRTVGKRSSRQTTCFYWKSGGTCRYSDQECKYAHYETGTNVPEKDQITCHFWYRTGTCAHAADACKFAHHDTGYYAGYPFKGTGTTSSKGRDSPNTKRIVVYDSESDDMKPRVSQEFSGSPHKVGPGAYNDALRTDRMDSNEGKETRPSTEIGFKVARILGKNDMEITEANPRSILPAIRQPPDPRATEVVPSLTSTNLIPFSKIESQDWSKEQLIDFGREETIVSRTPSSRPHPQVRAHQQVMKSDHSWVNDLRDLVFNDEESYSPRAGEHVAAQANSTSGPGHAITPTSQHDLLDLDVQASGRPNIQPIETSLNSPNTNQNIHRLGTPSGKTIELKDPKISSSIASHGDVSAFSPSGNTTPEPDDDDNTRSSSPTMPIKASNVYGDPLTKTGAKEDNAEPDIEEIFD